MTVFAPGIKTAERLSDKLPPLLTAKAAGKLNPDRMQAILQKADEYYEAEIPFLPLSLYRRFHLDGNRTAFEDLYFKRREMLHCLALAEAFAKSGKYTAKIADLLWAICEETTWLLPAHITNNPVAEPDGVPPVYDRTRVHGIALFSAETAALCALALSLCRAQIDKISPKIADRTEKEIAERITKPFLSLSFWWSGELGNKVINWGPWIASNILFAVSVCEKNRDTLAAVCDKCMDILTRFADGYPEDGGCEEGASYWEVAGGAYFDALEQLYDLSDGRINGFDNPKTKAICAYITKVRIAGTSLVNFGDCPPNCLPDGGMLRRMGARVGCPELTSFGEDCERIRLQIPNTGTGGQAHPSLATLTMPIAPDGKPTYPEKTWLPNLGVMTARENTDSPAGLFLAAKAGENAAAHSHNDVGNFIVYADGAPLIIDLGAEVYTAKTFSTERYTLMSTRSAYHNLPTFDGIEEKHGAEYQATDICYHENTGALSCNLAAAYPAEAGVVSFVRSSCLSDGCVCVTDDILLSDRRETVFHFMTPCEPRLTSPGKITFATSAEAGNLPPHTLTFAPELVAAIEEIPIADASIRENFGREKLFRICLSAKIKAGKFAFSFI